MDRAVVFGASRGLGRALAQLICAASWPVVGFGRKQDPLAAIRSEFPLFSYQVADLARRSGQDQAIDYLLKEPFSKVFCVAGGGPYGKFEDREWKDHEWALELSFIFPARVLHALLNAKRKPQVIVIGSAIAENEPDPLAASYCASKHALKGLVLTLQKENPDWDLRLFSPGYMDTDMLPKNAAVRQFSVWNPAQVAQELWTWSLTASVAAHKVYPKHPPTL